MGRDEFFSAHPIIIESSCFYDYACWINVYIANNNVLYCFRIHHSAIWDHCVCYNEHYEKQYGYDTQRHGHQNATGWECI